MYFVFKGCKREREMIIEEGSGSSHAMAPARVAWLFSCDVNPIIYSFIPYFIYLFILYRTYLYRTLFIPYFI